MINDDYRKDMSDLMSKLAVVLCRLDGVVISDVTDVIDEVISEWSGCTHDYIEKLENRIEELEDEE